MLPRNCSAMADGSPKTNYHSNGTKDFPKQCGDLSNYKTERYSGRNGTCTGNAWDNCNLGVSSSICSGTLLEEHIAQKAFNERRKNNTSFHRSLSVFFFQLNTIHTCVKVLIYSFCFFFLALDHMALLKWVSVHLNQPQIRMTLYEIDDSEDEDQDLLLVLPTSQQQHLIAQQQHQQQQHNDGSESEQWD